MVAMFENFVGVTQEEDVPQVTKNVFHFIYDLPFKYLPHPPSKKEVSH